jgi:hypothetical protein
MMGRDLVGAGGEPGLRPCGLHCMLSACAARSRHALAARAHSQLLRKIYEFIHDNSKKYI